MVKQTGTNSPSLLNYNPTQLYMTYQYSKTLRVPFEEVIMKVKDTLHQQGFTMISAMDVRDHMARDLGVNFRNYKILTACNPELSYKAISLEPHIGVFLPCSIV